VLDVFLFPLVIGGEDMTEERVWGWDKTLKLSRKWAHIREILRREFVYEAIFGCPDMAINRASLPLIGVEWQTTVVILPCLTSSAASILPRQEKYYCQTKKFRA
jgi:hypothetical protein